MVELRNPPVAELSPGGGPLLDVSSAAPRARGPARGHALWLVRRVVSGALVLLAVSVIVFVSTTALPGDAARRITGPDASAEQVAAVRHTLGLDRPLVDRYVEWLGGAVRGDFGRSLTGGEAVSSMISSRLGNSLSLLLCVAVLAIPASIALGALIAVRRDGLLDKTASTAALGLLALPDFVIAALVVMLLATTVFMVLPATSTLATDHAALAQPEYLVLPVLALSLIAGAYLVRMMRAAMIDILESDHVAMARLRGVPRRRLVWRHAVPNALVPAVQGSALMLCYLLGGIVLVEYIFNYPGLGTLLQSAVGYRDVPTVQGVALVFATGVVIFNLIADVLTVFLTPKLRTGAGR